MRRRTALRIIVVDLSSHTFCLSKTSQSKRQSSYADNITYDISSHFNILRILLSVSTIFNSRKISIVIYLGLLFCLLFRAWPPHQFFKFEPTASHCCCTERAVRTYIAMTIFPNQVVQICSISINKIFHFFLAKALSI